MVSRAVGPDQGHFRHFLETILRTAPDVTFFRIQPSTNNPITAALICLTVNPK